MAVATRKKKCKIGLISSIHTANFSERFMQLQRKRKKCRNSSILEYMLFLSSYNRWFSHFTWPYSINHSHNLNMQAKWFFLTVLFTHMKHQTITDAKLIFPQPFSSAISILILKTSPQNNYYVYTTRMSSMALIGQKVWSILVLSKR